MVPFRHRRFNAKRMVRSENDSVLFPMARFGIELIAKKDGYLPQNDFGSRFSAIACRLFLVPMAHFGIESIAKKDGYPSQNDFALSVSMARFGIELIAKRTDTFLKTTSGPALAR